MHASQPWLMWNALVRDLLIRMLWARGERGQCGGGGRGGGQALGASCAHQCEAKGTSADAAMSLRRQCRFYINWRVSNKQEGGGGGGGGRG